MKAVWERRGEQALMVLVLVIVLVPDRLFSLGPAFGPIMCIIIAIEHFFLWCLEIISPRDEIEQVESVWSHEAFEKVSNLLQNLICPQLVKKLEKLC
jgi:hypothetical protein